MDWVLDFRKANPKPLSGDVERPYSAGNINMWLALFLHLETNANISILRFLGHFIS